MKADTPIFSFNLRIYQKKKPSLFIMRLGKKKKSQDLLINKMIYDVYLGHKISYNIYLV